MYVYIVKAPYHLKRDCRSCLAATAITTTAITTNQGLRVTAQWFACFESTLLLLLLMLLLYLSNTLYSSAPHMKVLAYYSATTAAAAVAYNVHMPMSSLRGSLEYFLASFSLFLSSVFVQTFVHQSARNREAASATARVVQPHCDHNKRQVENHNITLNTGVASVTTANCLVARIMMLYEGLVKIIEYSLKFVAAVCCNKGSQNFRPTVFSCTLDLVETTPSGA
eukprot:14946-Heterococcus_DN1.PRE.2